MDRKVGPFYPLSPAAPNTAQTGWLRTAARPTGGASAGLTWAHHGVPSSLVLGPVWKSWIWMPEPLSKAWVILTLLALPEQTTPRVQSQSQCGGGDCSRVASEKGDLLGSLLWRSTLGAYALFPRFQGSAESQNGNVVNTDNNPNTTIDHVYLLI